MLFRKASSISMNNPHFLYGTSNPIPQFDLSLITLLLYRKGTVRSYRCAKDAAAFLKSGHLIQGIFRET